MTSRIPLAWTIAVALAAGGCAGGGPSGTHLATAQGNLVSVDSARLAPAPRDRTLYAWIAEILRGVGRAWAASEVEGVRVHIEATSFESVTDVNGSFVVRGEFAGPITLIFSRDADGFAARIGVEVPEGGTVTLRNVSCRQSDGLCEAEDIDVDEPSDDDVSEPSAEDPSDPPFPSPPDDDEIEQSLGADSHEGPGGDGDEEPSIE